MMIDSHSFDFFVRFFRVCLMIPTQLYYNIQYIFIMLLCIIIPRTGYDNIK
jgi:hypothetical protein